MINHIFGWLIRARARARTQTITKDNTPPNPLWQPTHMHRKGGYYRVIGPAIYEADRSDVVIYDDIEGTVWVRATAEFYDGRFTALTDLISPAKA